MKLRPYQEDIINQTRDALGRTNRVLIQSATGSGKTALAVFMMQRAAEAGKLQYSRFTKTSCYHKQAELCGSNGSSMG